MLIPLSSPGRLTRPELIAYLKELFIRHGALGRGSVSHDDVPTEELRMSLVPLVFGLLPLKAVDRMRYDIKVKPLIEVHLEQLGIDPDPELLDVLKAIADQFYMTKDKRSEYYMTKSKISHVRAMKGEVYKTLKSRQRNRCAVCGVAFDGTVDETLDHIIPWRLLGDVHDGSNWQILCCRCNRGKGSLLSVYQSPEAVNWVYNKRNFIADGDDILSDEARYVVIAARRKCSCGAGALSSRLHVQKARVLSMPVADAYEVFCAEHLDSGRPWH